MSKDDFVYKWWDILANGVRELALEFPTERSVRAFFYEQSGRRNASYLGKMRHGVGWSCRLLFGNAD